jgi:HEAT repeat protein
MPPLGYRRLTPLSTPVAGDPSATSAVPDGWAARGRLRALAALVDKLAQVGGGRAIMEADPEQQAAVREAVRVLTSRIREDALQCRLVHGQLILAGAPISATAAQDDPLLASLLQRCIALGIGGISVRQGAAPGELLMLATLLVRSPDASDRVPVSTDTPTSMISISADAPREIMRTWSVLVTPQESPATTRVPSVQDGISALAATGSTPGDATMAASALARLATARTDTAMSQAAALLLDQIADAEFRHDGRVLEGITRAVMAHLHTVGTGAGRLALERIVRELSRPRVVELLALRIPDAPDRLLLLELLSRTGELAVKVLVQLLMDAEDPPSRRAYFDSVVALDAGGALLFEMLRDPRWFVVRNAVALLGEMGVESADVVMTPLLRHSDDRIRVAVARALLRLSTPGALQGLHGAIEDRHPEVRRIAATSYALSGSSGVRTPAARLAAAFEREAEEDVALEMLAALGRLGSADAIQRLLRIALPPQVPDGVDRVPTREGYVRIAALEALVRARGAAAQSTIDLLLHDPDPQVASAAYRLKF